MARIVLHSLWIRLSIILTFTTKLELVWAVKPGQLLLDVLAKPFAPMERASFECLRDGRIYLEELERYAPWALLMYDASAKISPGVITGNYQQMGNYDECLRIRSPHGFVGQACTAFLQFDVTIIDEQNHVPDMGDLLLNTAKAWNLSEWSGGKSAMYEWMWCIPSSCTNADLQEALESALQPLTRKDRVELVVQVSRRACHTFQTDRRILDVADWIYISILMVFAIVILASTTYDTVRRRKPNDPKFQGKRHALLTSFSLYTNGKNLLRTQRNGTSIDCLDGLRYISICWIIYGHTHYNEVVSLKADMTEVVRGPNDWSFMLVLNGNIVTDTFFLLSGTLMAYTTMSKYKKSVVKSFDFVNHYVHRYLRLTPAYAMVIGFYATLFYKLGSGPRWDTWVGVNRDYCRANWWTNLLYVNNYINVASMCLSQSWYLAADMQLLWLSPILLYPMVKFARSIFFWSILAVSLILSVLSPLLVTYFNRLTGTMLYDKDQQDVANVYLQIYTRVYNRAGPYIIGLGLGHLLSKTRSCNFKIPTSYVIIAWIVATMAGLSVVFGPLRMYQSSYNEIEASLYAGFHRHVFSISVAWIIFASVYGYAGPIGKLLSWTGWMPLSKLTYSAYLCHFIILLADAGSNRTSKYLTHTSVARAFIGNLVLTMMVSTVCCLCFEMPFLALERSLKSRKNERANRKDRQEKNFGSTDTGNTICQSTDTLSTESEIFNGVDGPHQFSRDGIYKENGNIIPRVQLQDENHSQGKKGKQLEIPSYIVITDPPDYCDNTLVGLRKNEGKRRITCVNDIFGKSQSNLFDDGQKIVGLSIVSAKDLNENFRITAGESERPTFTYGSIGSDKGNAVLLPEASSADRSVLITPRRSVDKSKNGDEKNEANIAYQENHGYSNSAANSWNDLNSFTRNSDVGSNENENSGETVLPVSVSKAKHATNSRDGGINGKFIRESGTEDRETVIRADDHNFDRKFE